LIGIFSPGKHDAGKIQTGPQQTTATALAALLFPAALTQARNPLSGIAKLLAGKNPETKRPPRIWPRASSRAQHRQQGSRPANIHRFTRKAGHAQRNAIPPQQHPANGLDRRFTTTILVRRAQQPPAPGKRARMISATASAPATA